MTSPYCCVVFFLLAIIHVLSCPQEPEVLSFSNSLSNCYLTSSKFLHSFNSKLKEGLVCPVQNENDHLDDSQLSNLVDLVKIYEEGSKCLFDEAKWASIKKTLIKGERITEANDSDVFVISDFLTPRQCEELVKLQDEISESSTSEKWMFSTTKQLLDAVYEASLSPLEYNLSVGSSDSCDGGTLEGIDIGKKLMKVLNFSSSVLVPRGESSLVDSIESYIEEIIGLPRTNAFHTQLLKYHANSQYKNHTDCHGIENDRMATIIIYLTDVHEGGETTFPFLKKSVKPKRGTAVFWKNLDSNGQCDAATTHIATTVKKGVKYVFQKWFYERPLLPQYQNSDFTFCDLSLSCRQYIYNKSSEKAVQYMTKGQKADSYNEAIKYYELALLHQPLHSGSLILYADALTRLGYSHRALPYLLSVLKIHPRNKDAIEILKSVVDDLINTSKKH